MQTNNRPIPNDSEWPLATVFVITAKLVYHLRLTAPANFNMECPWTEDHSHHEYDE